jgi:spermidine synthase
LSAADRTFALVLLCFLLSGGSALVYQTAWTREFAFVFGTSELAVATVLAAYMGGLAAGAAVGGRLSRRVRRPVWVYGVLELLIGLSALAVPLGLRAATWLYVRAFGGGAETPEVGGLATAFFYTACAFLILTFPTGCMGATLPLLARHAVRDDAELGRRIGILYAVNTLGAVLGTVLAGFVLLPRLGLSATLACAVAANLLIFVLAALLSRSAPPAPPPAEARTAAAARARGIPLVLPLIAASGFASFTYEVLWTRLLGQLLGASVYAFATMLASFLVGIALGAAVAARFASSPRRAAAGFGLAQVATALLSLAAFALLQQMPALAARLAAGGTARFGADALVAGLVMLPSTLSIGATFPFAVRVLARGEEDAGPASARVYAWNTSGAIAGALGSGFFLIPALGFAATLAGGVGLNLVLAAASAGLARPPLGRLLALAAAGALALALLPPRTPWSVLRLTPLTLNPLAGEVEYYAVGRSTTVLLLAHKGRWWLTNNGLPEAAIEPPEAPPSVDRTVQWLGLLPALARPELRSMLVVGFGGGGVLEWIPPSVPRVDVIELEPEVIEANARVGPRRRHDPLRDPRVHLVLNDARNALALTGRRYDAVVSQPSHPWTAGASHLYTREFFELVKSRLAPGGVFLQWIGPAYVDRELLRILVGTLADTFASVRVYQPGALQGFLLLASEQPLPLERDAALALVRDAEWYRGVALRSPEDVEAALLFDEPGARRFAAGAPRNSDRRNHLQMRSPLLRLAGKGLLDGEQLVLEAGEPGAAAGLDPTRRLRALLELRFFERARRALRESRDPAWRELGAGLLAERLAAPQQAAAAYRRALAQRPEASEARAGLVRVLGAGAASDGALPGGGGGAEEAAVLGALAAEAERRSGALEALDPALAAVGPAHPLHAAAVRLRARWRIETGAPERVREAVALLDGLRGTWERPAVLLERARAAARIGDAELALASLEGLASGPAQDRQRSAPAAVALLRDLAVAEGARPWADDLLQRLAVPPAPRRRAGPPAGE